ncbi:hypothetical protein PMALA_032320 [Plasmodium malariae]|nr:hypothetical protein PMALA_032320 [Plasmodium malariae]
MDPAKKGNENFPARNSTERAINFDSAYPSFNIHYNFEPKDWRNIELVEKEKNDFLNNIKREIGSMEEDKIKINFVLNIQKQQIEELIFLINHIKYTMKNNKDEADEEEQELEMPQYLRSGNFNNSKADNNKMEGLFNEINDYTLNKFRLIEQDNFYHNLAEQWIS